jgi:type I restriction enzyme S subunit
MKVKSIPSRWIKKEGTRLDCGPYMSGALEAKMLLEDLSIPKHPLMTVTLRGLNGIYHAGRKSRIWVDNPEYGIPFLGSIDILATDLSWMPFISKKTVESTPEFIIRNGYTLITRSGTIGRMAFVRKSMDGLACSEHVMRVVPDSTKILPGYLYAYLSSKFGIPQIISGTYGSVIQSIEPQHIKDLPIPRFDRQAEQKIHDLISKAASLLSSFQSEMVSSTKAFFESVSLQDISAHDWHESGSDIGFKQVFPIVESFRGVNFNPRFKQLCKTIQNTSSWLNLGEICLPGTLRRGNRFKRIDAEPEHSYKLVGQKQLFWLRPEGRWIAKTVIPEDALVEPGTILVAARGTLGESELYCRSEFVWGGGTDLAYSEDILRVVADETKMLRGCLFAFMRSETAFRMLRSISIGTKLQDHHYAFLPKLPIPVPSRKDQEIIHQKVIQAYENRDKAIALEDQAIALVEKAIEEAA